MLFFKNKKDQFEYDDSLLPDDSALALSKNRMLEHDLKGRGIHLEHILEAISKVPREEFVDSENRVNAYADHPLEIGSGQTISQPYMVAIMTECLNPYKDDNVLEIGTGSGYQTAILSLLCKQVYTVERIPVLAEQAKDRFNRLGYANISVVVGDGTKGLAEYSPYNGIIVTAAAPEVPKTLVEQLANNGKLVIPVGSRGMQELLVIYKRGDRIDEYKKGSCVFVPLIGEFGWKG